MVEVVAGGRGDAEDVRLVAAELRDVPHAVANALRDRRIAIVACRNSVVDYAPRLSGVRPTNWDKNKTWDVVPGAYLQPERAVVVATVERDGRRAVPALNDLHGSASLAVHELFHGFDFSANRPPSRSNQFRNRWRADFASLKDQYFQDPDTGPGEAYAESGARIYGLWGGLRDAWPNLRDYWSTPDKADEGDIPREAQGLAPSIGLGRVAKDGSVQLFLTALGENGEHGHAMFEIAPANLPKSPAWADQERQVGETFDIYSLEGLDF